MEYVETVYLLGHQGWTDWFSQFSIYQYYINLYKKCIVLVIDEKQLPFVNRLFKNSGVGVEHASTEYSTDTTKKCVFCHMNVTETHCPRNPSTKCKILSEKYNNFQGICVFDKSKNWFDCVSTYYNTKSFVEMFYLHHNLEWETIYKNFNVDIDITNQIPIPKCNYIVYHDQVDHKITFKNVRKHKLNFIGKSEMLRISLSNISNDFFSALNLILNAKEIHLIQSSYCMFIYLLQLKYGLFSNIPVYVHLYARNNSDTEYKRMNQYPKLNNWTFLYASL
jgi:hypothetical protein